MDTEERTRCVITRLDTNLFQDYNNKGCSLPQKTKVKVIILFICPQKHQITLYSYLNLCRSLSWQCPCGRWWIPSMLSNFPSHQLSHLTTVIYIHLTMATKPHLLIKPNLPYTNIMILCSVAFDCSIKKLLQVHLFYSFSLATCLT